MENLKSYLTFKIDQEYYAAGVKNIQNIIEHTSITKVPQMPEYILGVINLRGIVLPVIDTRLKFGLTATIVNTNTCILVTEFEQDGNKLFIGALVDSVSEVLEIEENEIQAPPKVGLSIKNDFITGVYNQNDKFIMILDIERVFASDEILTIDATNI